MQLMVVKADGSEEGYLHTKVIAAIVNALGRPVFSEGLAADEISDIAGQLAESVTFYLYGKFGRDKISSSEIFSIILAVLSSTGFDDAAENLSEHHCRRCVLRTRVEVFESDVNRIADSVKSQQSVSEQPAGWDKSKIIKDLIAEYNLDIATARTVASIVEEKILASGFRTVPSVFIKFLVLMQTQAIFSAQRQLEETAVSQLNNNTSMEGRLRQPQNGLCPVEILPAAGVV